MSSELGADLLLNSPMDEETPISPPPAPAPPIPPPRPRPSFPAPPIPPPPPLGHIQLHLLHGESEKKEREVPPLTIQKRK